MTMPRFASPKRGTNTCSHARRIITLAIIGSRLTSCSSHGQQHRVYASTRDVNYGDTRHPLSRYLLENDNDSVTNQDNNSSDGDKSTSMDDDNEDDDVDETTRSFRIPKSNETQRRRRHRELNKSHLYNQSNNTILVTAGDIWTITGERNSTYNNNTDNTTFHNGTKSDYDISDLFIADKRNSSITYDNTTGLFPESDNFDPENLYRPIRLRAVLTSESGGMYLTEEQRTYLLDDVISPALQIWSQSLLVVPVEGNLTIDRNQLYDGQSCGPGVDSGLPSPLIPLEHLEQGVSDTDLLVYLSLGFRSDNISSTSEDNSTTPNLMTTNTNTSIPLPSDLFPPCLSDPTILASATYCSTDQYDRPIAGALHICITPDFSSPHRHRPNIITMIHELGHVLGMNSHSLAHFRTRDGRPTTPRDSHSNVPDVEVSCTGPGESHRTDVLPLPSSEVLRFRTVRNGVRVAEIVTPQVRLITRNQFNCHHLTGAELQTDSCIGEHFSRRLFREELLNPVVDDLDSFRPSPLTLALFWDAGWYRVNIEAVGPVSGWGRRGGCDFVERVCLKSGREEFCHLEGQVGCTPDMTRKAVCMRDEEEEQPLTIDELEEPQSQSQLPWMIQEEVCPTYVGYANGLCNEAENEYLLRVHPMEQFDLPNSRCLVGYFDRQKMALCLPIACVMSDESLRIKVDGVWQKCDKANQRLPVSTGGYVICPDASRTCPTFYCGTNCLGTEEGVCDYDTGECLCPENVTNPNHPNFLRKQNMNPNITVCGDNITTAPKEDQRILETKLSEYYVPDSTLLQNDTVLGGDGGNNSRNPFQFFMNMSSAERIALLFTLLFTIVGFAALGYNTYDKRRQRWKMRKDKMVASVLVDLRVHDPMRGGLSRAAKLTIEDENEEQQVIKGKGIKKKTRFVKRKTERNKSIMENSIVRMRRACRMGTLSQDHENHRTIRGLETTTTMSSISETMSRSMSENHTLESEAELSCCQESDLEFKSDELVDKVNDDISTDGIEMENVELKNCTTNLDCIN